MRMKQMPAFAPAPTFTRMVAPEATVPFVRLTFTARVTSPAAAPGTIVLVMLAAPAAVCTCTFPAAAPPERM